MKIARYEHAGQAGWGLVEQDHVLPLPGARDFAQAWATAHATPVPGASAPSTGARPADSGMPLMLDDIRWLAPVLPGNKIICVGLNYRKHAQEVARESGGHPSVFTRYADSFVGHGEHVVRPHVSDTLDYEAELAVVIGTPARYVREEDALRYVAGYTCMAENSVREFQMHNRQATPGKNFERSGALGPWIVSADAMPDLAQVTVTGRLNGVQMQQAGLDELVFGIPSLIAYLSLFTTLHPGDIIATGTPEGVGMTQSPPRYLRRGDRFEVDINGIGVLANPVADEEA
jgi:2-keto-4-pentenoate hydratase/2-oxohepta-3-ene-1,7-dioic acid hydratase in catechol pathway